MNYFFTGSTEIFTNALPLLVITALGLALGQQINRSERWALPLFLCTLGLGLQLGKMRIGVSDIYSPLSLELAGIVAFGAVLRLKLPLLVVVLFSMACGLVLGLSIKPLLLPGFMSYKVYSVLAGISAAATLLLALVTGVSLVLQRFWDGVLVRAMASWVLASALMVLVLIATKTFKV